MAYDTDLADRLRDVLQEHAPQVTEKRMFGGLAFLVDGRMVVAASGKGGLLLRVDPTRSATFVHESGISRFVMRGREMDGWLHVEPDAVADDAQLERWLSVALSYVRTLRD